MLSRIFDIGTVYHATPVLQGQPRRLASLIGRDGRNLQFAFVDELACGVVVAFNGRETAQIETQIGRYNISTAAPAPAQETAIVNAIILRKGL